ncbi:WD40 repeat domain-containing protein, partial [Streptomyces sp. NPDC058394]|uniref:WD40 repeat domain-containing protein n=1 Tax=Streptomyces sp. NPDC058394 TaxID=3346477 RepID=UPI003652FC27
QVGDPLTGHTNWIQAVACTVLDGQPMAVTGSNDQTVRVWDLTTGQQVGDPLTGHTGWIPSVACTVLDGRPVAVTGSNDETVRVWDLRTAKMVDCLSVMAGALLAELTPDEHLIVATGVDVAVFTRQKARGTADS